MLNWGQPLFDKIHRLLQSGFTVKAASSSADSRYISVIVTTRYWGSQYSLLGIRYLNRYSVTEAAAVITYSVGRSTNGQFVKSISIGLIRPVFVYRKNAGRNCIKYKRSSKYNRL